MYQKHAQQTWYINLFLKGQNIKEDLTLPKDKDTIKQISGIIHCFRYSRLDCDEKHLGELARTLMKGLRNILRHLHWSLNAGPTQATVH